MKGNSENPMKKISLYEFGIFHSKLGEGSMQPLQGLYQEGLTANACSMLEKMPRRVNSQSRVSTENGLRALLMLDPCKS